MEDSYESSIYFDGDGELDSSYWDVAIPYYYNNSISLYIYIKKIIVSS